MNVTIRKVRYHQDAWEDRGGLWVIECGDCESFGDAFLVGYRDAATAGHAADRHKCDPRAVAQVED